MDRPDKRPGVQTDAVNSEPQNLAHDPPEIRQPIDELDKPRTYKDAAKALGVGYHVVQRATRRGLVPTVGLGTSRRYVKLRDFFDLMSALSRFKPSADRVADSYVRRSGWRFIRHQPVPELDGLDACVEEALVAHALDVRTHDPANLMLDASVSLNTATLAASDVDVHSAD